MNRELLKQMGQAAIDFANGESVQYLYLTQWIDIDETHCFCPDKKYRVKPKPRIIWVAQTEGGSIYAFGTDKKDALSAARVAGSIPSFSGVKAVPYRELTPEEREEAGI